MLKSGDAHTLALGRANSGGERVCERGAEIAGIELFALVREVGFGVNIYLAADLLPQAAEAVVFRQIAPRFSGSTITSKKR